MEETTLDKRVRLLREEAQKLIVLLDDKDGYGMATWMSMVGDRRTEINAIMDGERD